MSKRNAGRTLIPAALAELPLGAVRPAGWLAEQLRLQASGLTGALEEIWPDVGPTSAWLGGTGEDWERGPYYVDGLVPLAHLLADEALLAKADRWIDWMLASQREDGQFGPRSNEDWWPRMVALKVLMQHHDATGDPRVLAFLTGYLRYQYTELPTRPLRDWGRVRGADNLLAVYWLHDRTGDPFLLGLADVLLAQIADWGAYLRELPCTEPATTWDYMTHVVNVAMGLKTPAVQYRRDGDPRHQSTLEAGWANLIQHHGQVHGMFSGDEWLAGPGASRGVELCAVVELMYTFEQLLAVYGAAEYGDRLERLAYNLLPAALTADARAHQYHQQANQVLVTIAQRDWTAAMDDCTIFGLEPNYGCCTANLHQGWPKFVRSLWMVGPGGALAATAYGPSTVGWERDGRPVEIESITDYPFDDTVVLHVRNANAVPFRLRLRVPGWCSEPAVNLNGKPIDTPPTQGWLEIERTWMDGDTVELRMPMTPYVIPRARGAIGVGLGPLVLAFSPGEVWSRLPDSPGFGDWEVRPRRSWNIALAIAEDSVGGIGQIERAGPLSPPFGLRTGPPPFGVEGVPLKVWVPGRRVPAWLLAGNSAALPPDGPLDPVDGTTDNLIPLVPYGCARIRVAEFPTATPSLTGVRRGATDPPFDVDAPR